MPNVNDSRIYQSYSHAQAPEPVLSCRGNLKAGMHRSIWILVGCVLSVTIIGCGGGTFQNSSHKSSQNPPPAIAVAVSPSSATITTSQTRLFKATVLNDNSAKGVTWAISGPGCSRAGCGILSNAGTSVTYTAPDTVPNPADVALRATSLADSAISATASLTIFPPGLASVTISPAAPSVQTRSSIQLTATVANDPANAVSWSMTEPTNYCSIFPCGKLTPGTAGTATYAAPSFLVAPGPTITIKATSVIDNTATDSVLVTITCAVSSDCIP